MKASFIKRNDSKNSPQKNRIPRVYLTSVFILIALLFSLSSCAGGKEESGGGEEESGDENDGNGESTSVTYPSSAWTVNTNPGTTGSVFNAFAYNGTHKYIAVGSSATSLPEIASSSNGSNWTLDTPYDSDRIALTLAYGNGKFVSTSNFGTIFSSGDDGGTWSKSRVSGNSLTGIYADATNDLYVMVSTDGIIYRGTDTTSDAISFSVIDISADVAFNDVVGDGSADSQTLVAMGNGGVIYRSTDSGVTWSAATSSKTTTTADIKRVYHTPKGLYLALTATDTLYSTDGDNWTASVRALKDVAIPDTVRPVLGAGTTAGEIYSTNDVTSDGPWNLVSTAPTNGLSSSVAIVQIEWGNLRHVAIGSDGAVYESTSDGVNWTSVTVNGDLVSTNISSMTYGGGSSFYVNGGSSANMGRLDMTGASTYNYTSLTHKMDRMVYDGVSKAVGLVHDTTVTPNFYALYSSKDITSDSWDNRFELYPNQKFKFLEYEAGNFVSFLGGGALIAKSSNGTDWTLRKIPGGSRIYYNGDHNAGLAYGTAIGFVMLFQDPSGDTKAVISDASADSWATYSATGLVGGSTDMASNGIDKFVSITLSGVHYSSDGKSWTSVPLADMAQNLGTLSSQDLTDLGRFYFRSIDYTTPNFYLLATSYLESRSLVFISSDGKNWDLYETNLGEKLTTMFAGDGKLLIGGNALLAEHNLTFP